MLVWFYSGACRASFPLLLDMLLTCVFVVGCRGGEGQGGLPGGQDYIIVVFKHTYTFIQYYYYCCFCY